MKRREQILLVSLEMFNAKGEVNLSAVDIANEMEISPGNLYYHYKGKEEIVEALFDQFERGLRTLLQESLVAESTFESMLVVVLVLLEQIYQYRFLYRNSNDLINKYPAIERRFRRLMKLKHALVVSTLQLLLEERLLDADMVLLGGVDEIADSVTMILTCYYEFQRLNGKEENKQQYVRGCLNRVSSAISPYAGQSMAVYINFLDEFIESQTQ